MMDFNEVEEEVLKLGRGKYSRYSTPTINKSKLSKIEMDAFFLSEEDAILVQEDYYD
jgi:hypothetical protein